MRRPRADAAVRLLIVGASIGVLILLALIVCLVIALALYPDATRALLGTEPLLD